jgi:hypothetical protein
MLTSQQIPGRLIGSQIGVRTMSSVPVSASFCHASPTVVAD